MKHIFKSIVLPRKANVTKYLLLLIMLTSCEDFLVIDPPNNQLTGATVFEDRATVNAAMIYIYTQLRDNTLTSGNNLGLPYLLGLYSDELTLYSTNASFISFYENTLLPSQSSIANLWNSSYNLIYATNTIIEGVQNSDMLSEDDKELFLGEAYFIRAFIHFYLVNTFGAVPYIKTTDYRTNTQVSKQSIAEVYQMLSDDLVLAKSLLASAPVEADKTRPNKWVATALLARVYLYDENWEMALKEAGEVLNNKDYVLNSDINEVFLKTSTETLWQYDTGVEGFNTLDAQLYIFTSGPPPNNALSSSLVANFETDDLRLSNWIGSVSNGSETWYYPYKYKQNANTANTEECSIVFRLAELYLISAEANVHLGNVPDALIQLNEIRERANLDPILFTDQTNVLNAILQERRMELFSEMGHRFFDLKRTGSINDVLSQVKSNWQATDVRFPYPESELILNPNLEPQNEGY